MRPTPFVGSLVVTDRLLDAHEVAERLNVPVSWVRESTRSGAMPHVELGRYKRYRLDTAEGRTGIGGEARRRHPRPPEAESAHLRGSGRRVRDGRVGVETTEEDNGRVVHDDPLPPPPPRVRSHGPRAAVTIARGVRAVRGDEDGRRPRRQD